MIEGNNKVNNSRYNNDFTGGDVNLNLSFKNYEIDEENRRKLRNIYCRDLNNQIKEREVQRENEKKKLKYLELLDEERLKRERDYLNKKAIEEEIIRKEEIEKYKNENERIMNSYAVLSHPKKKKILLKSSVLPVIKICSNEKTKTENELFYENIINDLEKIRGKMIESQNVIITQIKKIKKENINSDKIKTNFKQSISDIREELQKKYYQENLQKEILYRSLVDSKIRKLEMNNIFRSADYINISHNLSFNERIDKDKFKNNFETNLFRDNINKNYKKDKLNLNKILNKNEERLHRLDRISEMLNS